MPDPTTTPQTDEDAFMPEPLYIHSWSPTTGLNDAVVIDVTTKRSADAANFAINRLKARAQVDRTIRFWGAAPDMGEGDQGQTLVEGVSTQAWYKFYRDFFQRLAAAKVTPEFMILDHESTLSYWSWSALTTIQPTARQASKLDDTIARLTAAGKLPSYLNGVEGADFNFSAAGLQTISRWNRYCREVTWDAIRAGVAVACQRAYGRLLPMSNWEDHRPTFPIYDHNDVATDAENAQSLAGWASPACYINSAGWRYQNRKLPVQWNSFLDCLNHVRSNLARSVNVAPWISYSAYSQEAGQSLTSVRWLWRQMMLHLRATGVRRLLYWNPAEMVRGPSEDTFAKGVFAELAALAGTRQELPEIPMDTDQVTTAGITTRYADYMKQLNTGNTSTGLPGRTGFIPRSRQPVISRESDLSRKRIPSG